MAPNTRVDLSTYQPTGGRKMRRPEHRFQLRTRPWQIVPFMIAPVLPGETMKNLLLQSRVVCDPVKNPLIGWWTEHYFFYVKHRDLDARDLLTEMVLDPEADLSSLQTTGWPAYYHAAGGINYTELCVRRITQTFFRDGDEAWNMAGTIVGGYPMAQASGPGWLDSVVNASEFTTEGGDIDVDLNADGDITASEVDKAMAHWQFMRQYNLTDMSYEDYLATYGVSRPRVELHEPELIRYTRNWTYPSATVNPADGRPSSAPVWSVAERADKDRFFSEPGFIVGLSVTRPKVYFRRQRGSATHHMMNAFSWLPATLTNDMSVGRLQFDSQAASPVVLGKGPLDGTDENYWIDVRDILMYGDQFVNFALTETDAGFVGLPTAGMQKKYVPEGDLDGLFSDAAGETKRNLIRQDGIVNLGILSVQRDVT